MVPLSFKVSAVCAAVSLVLAYLFRTHWHAMLNPYGYWLLALWALIPPLWFLFEFNQDFPANETHDASKVERMKHLQALSRNLWLAFVVVLAAIMGIKWPIE